MERPEGVIVSSSKRVKCQAAGTGAKRKRMSTADCLGWVAGAKVLDACGIEHIIQAMQHGYVQCSRPGCTGLRNYRRKELQLLQESSGDEDSHSSASGEDRGDPQSDEASDQGDGWEAAGMAREEP